MRAIATSASSAYRTQTSPPANVAMSLSGVLQKAQPLPWPPAGAGHEAGLRAGRQRPDPQTTALVCATDTLALGASKYLQEHRIDDLQVASVGSTPLMKFLHPEIITVDPGYAESGRQAATQLIEQINGRTEPRQIVIPAHLS
jgi:LacI family trehalose operon transcriptional repressor